mmetsp:Transcript_63355/g.151163  ORF Transcript_63355/g.151163 Transcript_63355/m.151163 type:complete len:920 (+) Transcript_63355:76-2835(+)
MTCKESHADATGEEAFLGGSGSSTQGDSLEEVRKLHEELRSLNRQLLRVRTVVERGYARLQEALQLERGSLGLTNVGARASRVDVLLRGFRGAQSREVELATKIDATLQALLEVKQRAQLKVKRNRRQRRKQRNGTDHMPNGSGRPAAALVIVVALKCGLALASTMGILTGIKSLQKREKGVERVQFRWRKDVLHSAENKRDRKWRRKHCREEAAGSTSSPAAEHCSSPRRLHTDFHMIWKPADTDYRLHVILTVWNAASAQRAIDEIRKLVGVSQLWAVVDSGVAEWLKKKTKLGSKIDMNEADRAETAPHDRVQGYCRHLNIHHWRSSKAFLELDLAAEDLLQEVEKEAHQLVATPIRAFVGMTTLALRECIEVILKENNVMLVLDVHAMRKDSRGLEDDIRLRLVGASASAVSAASISLRSLFEPGAFLPRSLPSCGAATGLVFTDQKKAPPKEMSPKVLLNEAMRPLLAELKVGVRLCAEHLWTTGQKGKRCCTKRSEHLELDPSKLAESTRSESAAEQGESTQGRDADSRAGGSERGGVPQQNSMFEGFDGAFATCRAVISVVKRSVCSPCDCLVTGSTWVCIAGDASCVDRLVGMAMYHIQVQQRVAQSLHQDDLPDLFGEREKLTLREDASIDAEALYASLSRTGYPERRLRLPVLLLRFTHSHVHSEFIFGDSHRHAQESIYKLHHDLFTGRLQSEELTRADPLYVFLHRGPDNNIYFYSRSNRRLAALQMLQALRRDSSVMVHCRIFRDDATGTSPGKTRKSLSQWFLDGFTSHNKLGLSIQSKGQASVAMHLQHPIFNPARTALQSVRLLAQERDGESKVLSKKKRSIRQFLQGVKLKTVYREGFAAREMLSLCSDDSDQDARSSKTLLRRARSPGLKSRTGLRCVALRGRSVARRCTPSKRKQSALVT